MPQRISAIDIGSNAIRMIIGETQGSRLQIFKKYRTPIRLGHDVFTIGKISEENLQKAELAFKDFARLNQEYQVEKYTAVGTSALREAKNQEEFIQRIERASHIKVKVIDGIKEAETIFTAVKNEIDLYKKHAVLIDVGGGSVEVTLCHDEKIQATRSFPLGTVRLLENLKKRHMNESELNVVIGDIMNPLIDHLQKNSARTKYDFAVGTGGNLEAMARLKVRLLGKTPNTFVILSELTEISQILRKHTVKERIEKLKLRPDRADVIVPAIMVVKTILRQAGIEKILIPEVGLRDGLLWSLVESPRQ